MKGIWSGLKEFKAKPISSVDMIYIDKSYCKDWGVYHVFKHTEELLI